MKLHREKCSELEEQQLHLNVGLSKIAETVEQVEEMQKSLAVKSQVRRNFPGTKRDETQYSYFYDSSYVGTKSQE